MAISRRLVNKLRPARDAYKYKEKVRGIKVMASKGDADANFWLGEAYLAMPRQPLEPRYVLKFDEKLAVRHLRLAAKQQHPEALMRLAKLHAHIHTHGDSDIVKYDMAKALELTVQAAESGSAMARNVLVRRRLKEGSLAVLLLDAEKGRGVPSFFSASRSDLADAFIDEYRAQPAPGKATPIPADGEALHPLKNKPYSVARTEWIDGRVAPDSPGVYERQFTTTGEPKVLYSYWTGNVWSKRKRHPEDLMNALKSVLGESGRQRLPWRGLANNPEMAYVSYVAAPGKLRPGFGFGGYVEHKEPGSPLVKMIHVAKSVSSRDGDYLTACGYRLRDNEGLRLWSRSEEIKVVDGCQPVLCEVCRKKAFLEFAADAEVDLIC